MKNWLKLQKTRLQEWLQELWHDMTTELAWKILYGIIGLLTLADAYLKFFYHGNKEVKLTMPVAGAFTIAAICVGIFVATAGVTPRQANKFFRFALALIAIATWIIVFPW